MSDFESVPEDDFEAVNKEGSLSEDEVATASYASRDDDQGMASSSMAEVAKKEKQRLRELERLRKERLENLRQEQNSKSQEGQVRPLQWSFCPRETCAAIEGRQPVQLLDAAGRDFQALCAQRD